MNSSNIIFFGTPDFVISIPETLLKAGFDLVALVTTPDKPIGRKGILTPSPVKVWTQKKGITVIDSPSIEDITSEVRKLKSTVGILASYGKIIPQSLIDLFPKGILVIHPSLLPKYRGASPVQAAISSGDKKIGVSIIKMDAKMDHGPIVFQFSEELPSGATPDKLYPQLFQKSAEELVKILPDYLEDKIKFKEQDHSQATFCKILTRQDGKIDWQKSNEEIERFIRAMTPWPGAWTEVKIDDQKKRLKILKAHLEENELIIDQVQLEGKSPVSWEQFKKGYPKTEFPN